MRGEKGRQSRPLPPKCSGIINANDVTPGPGTERQSGTEKPETDSRPRSGKWWYEQSIHRIEFDAVAGMHIFHSEDDHPGCSRIGHADDHDLADRSTRQVAHVNHGSISLLVEHARIKRRHLLLGVLGN